MRAHRYCSSHLTRRIGTCSANAAAAGTERRGARAKSTGSPLPSRVSCLLGEWVAGLKAPGDAQRVTEQCLRTPASVITDQAGGCSRLQHEPIRRAMITMQPQAAGSAVVFLHLEGATPPQPSPYRTALAGPPCPLPTPGHGRRGPFARAAPFSPGQARIFCGLPCRGPPGRGANRSLGRPVLRLPVRTDCCSAAGMTRYRAGGPQRPTLQVESAPRRAALDQVQGRM